MGKGDWMTVEQFAEWTGSAVSTIRNMCKQKKLPSKKFGVRWKINVQKFNEQMELEMMPQEEVPVMAEVPMVAPKVVRRTYTSTPASEWLKGKRAMLLSRIEVVK